MAKRPTIVVVGSGFFSNNDQNTNFTNIKEHFDNFLSLDGSTPNTMAADLDMGSNDVNNVGTITATEAVINGSSVAASAAAAAASASAAATSETNAATSETNAAASAANVVGWEWKGAWATTTAYVTNNIVYVTAGTWEGYGMICTADHTSDGTSFDNDYPANWDILVKEGAAGAGSGDMISTNNLSDVANAGTSRTNLGVAIGSDVQAYDAGLLSIAGLTTAADKMIYTSALDTYATADLTAEARSFLALTTNQAQINDVSPLTTAGDIVYYSGGNTTRLAVGTEGQVLTINSGAPSWQTGSTMTETTPQATTSGTAIDWSSIPSGTKRIIITFDQCELGSGKILVQLGDSGGLETTGYVSACTVMAVGRSNSTSGFLCEHSGANGQQSGMIIMQRSDPTNNGWVYMSQVVSQGAGTYVQNGAGSKDLSAELDRVRLTTTTGSTFTAGEATLTYES